MAAASPLSRLVLLLLLLFIPTLGKAATAGAPASYQEALDKFKSGQAKSGKSGYTPEERAVMQRAKASLARRMPDPGIKVGQHAPDFSLANAFGQPVKLSDALKKGPVVLVFYRGAWCPFCNMHLHALQTSLPQFKRYGAQLIAITPQKPDKSAAQVKQDNYPFEVLSDLDSTVMKAYRLYFEVDDEVAAVYKKHGLDLTEYNGEGRNVLPVPGTFVIDTQGIVRAMHADQDYTQRMEPDAIVAALRSLSGER